MSIYDDFIVFVKTFQYGNEYKYVKRLQDTAYYSKPFIVDYVDVYNETPEYSLALIENPEKTIQETSKYVLQELRQINPEYYSDETEDFTIRIKGLLQSVPIKKLSHKQLGRLIQIEGIITSQGNPYPRMIDICYKCLICGEEQYIHQDSQFKRTPQRCVDKECKNRKSFDIIPRKTRYETRQNGVIQETPETTSGGSIPKNFKYELSGDICDTLKVGSIVKLVGWVDGRLFKKNDVNPVLDLYFNVNFAENVNAETTISNITEEEKQKYHEWVKQPDFIEQLIASTCPTLYGMEEVKLFLDLQQVGGVPKNIGGKWKRGSIHGQLAGDPGEGKSVCLEWQTDMSNRGIMVTGGGASGVGLTASVDRDQVTKEWVLRAGALVLADNGHVSIDEIEKMRDEDRNHIHPAMEQQKISVNKAGINTELYTRCSILGASNPKEGQWGDLPDIGDNVDNLPQSLLSRFDCIFILKNSRTVEEEMKRADYVLKLHKTGKDESKVDRSFLKKYFSYARTFTPKITDEVEKTIRELYETLIRARMSLEGRPLMISMRQLEGLIRLAEASAKLYLRDKTTVKDAHLAIRVMKASIFEAAIDPETGNVDFSRFYRDDSKPKSKKDSYKGIVDLIRGYTVANDCKGIEETELLKMLEKHKVKMLEASALLDDMEHFSPPFIYRNGSLICLA